MELEAIIGLEIHVEMKTKSKMFSSSPVTFGETPNTQTTLLDFAFPGTLPSVNKQAVINDLFFDDFDTFVDAYDNSGTTMVDFMQILEGNDHAVLFSSSGSIDYGLGYEIIDGVTPISYFPNGVPLYGGFDYNLLQFGDILMESTSNFNHTAIITNTNKYGVSGATTFRYIETVEALRDDGVLVCYLDDQRIIDKDIKIIRYRNGISDNQKNNIMYFLEQQLSKPYSIDLTNIGLGIDNATWYCNELVYASMLYAGIDLLPGSSPTFIYGTAFLDSVATTEIDISFQSLITILISNKTNGKWNLRIFNETNSTKNIVYNKKMCFLNDAKNWTNLTNVSEPEIVYSYHYMDATISENFFADYITASFVVTRLGRNERFITYGNGLNSSNHSYNEKTNIIFF